MKYIGDSDSCSVYIEKEKLMIERKIQSGKRIKTIRCRYDGTQWNSKLVDTLSGEKNISSGSLEKVSSDIENILGIKIISRHNLRELLSGYFIGGE